LGAEAEEPVIAQPEAAVETVGVKWVRAARLLTLAILIGIAAGATSPAVAKKKKPKSTFLYVHDGAAAEVHALAVTPATGDLSAVAGSPFGTGGLSTACGGFCQTIAYSAKKKLLFVSGLDGVTVFNVAADGTLAVVAGSPFGGTPVVGVATITKGKKTFVYATGQSPAAILGFKVGKGGKLIALGGFPVLVGSQPVGAAIAGGRLFVADQTQTNVRVFAIAGNGKLTEAPGSPVALGGMVFNVSPDPGGGFFYAPDQLGGAVPGFRTTATLPALAGSPFDLGYTGGGGLVLGPGGVGALFFETGIQPVTRNAAGVLATSGAFVDFGFASPDSAAFDETGTLLGLADSGTDTVRLYAVTPGTGALLPTDTESATLSNGSAGGTTFAVR